MSNSLSVFAPFDRHVITDVKLNSASDAERALESAHRLSRDRARWLPTWERIAILEKAHGLIASRKEALVKKAAEEGGKPWADSKERSTAAFRALKSRSKA